MFLLQIISLKFEKNELSEMYVQYKEGYFWGTI